MGQAQRGRRGLSAIVFGSSLRNLTYGLQDRGYLFIGDEWLAR